jgi:peroxin-5
MPKCTESDNPYLELASGALLPRAKELLAKNGSLDEAALLCEAAIRKGELGDGGFEAWILLGQARSMDERESHALKALREGTKIAQERGNMEAGMLVSLYVIFFRITFSALPSPSTGFGY